MTNQRHFQSARSNCKGTTCSGVRRWQHKPHVAILRPRASTPQSPVAVTHLHTGCCSFYLPPSISNCSAERSMIRMKLITSRLRFTVTDEWLNGLMLMSAEKDVVDNLDVDIIINRFAKSSTRMRRYSMPSWIVNRLTLSDSLYLPIVISTDNR